MSEFDSAPHVHKTKEGLAVKCYHVCKHACKNSILSFSFWAGVTLSFPLEHFIWEKVWPFTLVTQYLGL